MIFASTTASCPAPLTSAIVDFVDQVGSATPADGPREQTVSRRTIGIAGLSVVLVLALGGWLHGRSRQRPVESEQLPDDEETDPARGWSGVADRQAGTWRA